MTLTGTLAHLVVPSALFVAIHLLVSGTPLRGVIVRAIGERPFLIAFGVTSAASLVWMVAAYNAAPIEPLWDGRAWRWLVWVAMPFALFFFVCAFSTRNPTAAGATLPAPDRIPGPMRITRHPFLWSVAIWAFAHALANGDDASLIFFGVLFVVAMVGTVSIDAKRRRRTPEEWAPFAAATSIVPGAALLGGRTRVTFAEIGWWRIALALVVYAGLMHLHGPVIGIPAY